jgi:hypothetical protein
MTHNFLFFTNIIAVFLISVSCFKIAYRWKKIKSLSTNFYSLGIFYFLIFIFISYWNYTHVLFSLIVGSILLLVWGLLFFAGTFVIFPTKKSPFDYAFLIYILLPFIYLFTKSIELTFVSITALTSFIILFTFIKILFLGKRPLKIASLFGVIAGLVSIFHAFVFLIELNIPMYSLLLINVFLAISFGGLSYISKNNPNDFLSHYNHEKYSN